MDSMKEEVEFLRARADLAERERDMARADLEELQADHKELIDAVNDYFWCSSVGQHAKAKVLEKARGVKP